MKTENNIEKEKERKKDWERYFFKLYSETLDNFQKYISKNYNLNLEEIVKKPNLVIYESESIFSPLKYDVDKRTIFIPSHIFEEVENGNVYQSNVRIKEEIMHHILFELNKYLREKYLKSSYFKGNFLRIVYEILTYSFLYSITSNKKEKEILSMLSSEIIKNSRILEKILSYFIDHSLYGDEKKLKKFVRKVVDYLLY